MDKSVLPSLGHTVKKVHYNGFPQLLLLSIYVHSVSFCVLMCVCVFMCVCEI